MNETLVKVTKKKRKAWKFIGQSLESKNQSRPEVKKLNFSKEKYVLTESNSEPKMSV